MLAKRTTFGWDYHFSREIIRFDKFIVTCYGEIGEPVKGSFSTTHDGIQMEGTFHTTRVN